MAVAGWEIVSLFSLICLGMYFRRKGIITEVTEVFLSEFALDFALPSMLLISLSSTDAGVIKRQLPVLLGVTVAAYLFMVVFCGVMLRFLPAFRGSFKTLIILGIFNNVANIGYPVMGSLFGAQGILCATFSNLIFVVLLWTAGVAILSGEDGKSEGGGISFKAVLRKGKKICTPGLAAIVVGDILCLCSIKLPYVIEITLTKVGNTMVPLAMLIIGCSLAKQDLSRIFLKKPLWIFVLGKQVLMPLLFFALCSLFPVGKDMLVMETVLIAMPSAVNLAAFVRRQEGDYVLASQAIVLTTLVSLVTVPMIAGITGGISLY